jgi:transposase-like protein
MTDSVPNWAIALASAEACRPTRCPSCGSPEICPMFDRDMLAWTCTDCGRAFCERD